MGFRIENFARVSLRSWLRLCNLCRVMQVPLRVPKEKFRANQNIHIYNTTPKVTKMELSLVLERTYIYIVVFIRVNSTLYTR